MGFRRSNGNRRAVREIYKIREQLRRETDAGIAALTAARTSVSAGGAR